MKRIVATTLLIALTQIGSFRCDSAQPPPADPVLLEGEPIKPLPIQLSLDSRKVTLGRELFSDPKLSRDNTVSCASCHDLRSSGADGRPHSLGINKAEGP